ncbi:hypothetical protein RYR28_000511 [Edwardsiella piscicida]|uniref:Uncharacterized protein n=1 Tax=Edwardsiella piscicida TaxID=1263550 RepID=A0AAQ3C4Y5_EDWPI|nr:hypothetical protein [Edwardsiella piscicida]AGH73373.1 hypothetical protein ETAC_06250 [Edwardsiella piscicida C07-087]AOP42685.1 hypothetical protein A9797_06430 [Edwardsiella piscicida]ARD17116.1 hypothetical protein BXA22_01485 [Edwardsiella piscicida]EKS7765054.1 hypothetical protein [Edwardsiella piscicida]EKS7779059.1 hypothetical protein [Edwardsiella piscicida]
MYFATEDNFWRFYTNACGQWGWCVVAPTGYIVRHSVGFFPRRRDCLADARIHGYQDQPLTADC